MEGHYFYIYTTFGMQVSNQNNLKNVGFIYSIFTWPNGWMIPHMMCVMIKGRDIIKSGGYFSLFMI